MTVAAVVFDLGNVVVEWNPEAYYDARIGRPAREEMFAETGIHAVNTAADEGAPFRESFYALADRFPRWSAEIRLWHDDQMAMTQPVIHGTLRLIDALKARAVPVFALSNWGDESFDRAAAHYPFLAAFDRLYVSGKLKMKKPDPAIYAHVEADSGVKPERLLFIDDRIENIRAAGARGWRVHRFDGPPGLAHRLLAEGLIGVEDVA
ncbi:MAG: HAD family hydrolase [Paracoccaceae bacterium]